MKTGIELIAKERQEQIEKHGRTLKYDREVNANDQLSIAAYVLMEAKDTETMMVTAHDTLPERWSLKMWQKMWDKPYKERLIIAGALIAAEIDRIQSIED
ncbi:MAG: hypothetical protein V2B15_08725 [Bacteroidota bacterium]